MNSQGSMYYMPYSFASRFSYLEYESVLIHLLEPRMAVELMCLASATSCFVTCGNPLFQVHHKQQIVHTSHWCCWSLRGGDWCIHGTVGAVALDQLRSIKRF